MLLGISVLKRKLQQAQPLLLPEVENEPVAGSLEQQGPLGCIYPPGERRERRAVCPPRSPGLVYMAFSIFPGQRG